MVVLGINSYHSGASAAILVDGKIVAAAKEEIFNGISSSAGFPYNSIKFCVDYLGISPVEIDYIVIPRNPLARLPSKFFYALRMSGYTIKQIKDLFHPRSIRREVAKALNVSCENITSRFHRVEHHLAHLAASFYTSPFEKSILLSIDGIGDFTSTMWGVGESNKIKPLGHISFPHSIGLFYTAFAQYLGFVNYGEENKLMELSSLGDPIFYDEMKKILIYDYPLNYKLNLDYFTFHKKGISLYWQENKPKLDSLFNRHLETRLGPRRGVDERIELRHKQVAASVQMRLESAVYDILNELYSQKFIPNLSYAGGVAYNSVLNGKIAKKTSIRNIFIHSATDDAGLSLGAALYFYYNILDRQRIGTDLFSPYLGPSHSISRVKSAIRKKRLKIIDTKNPMKLVSLDLAAGKIIALFQGRVEWSKFSLGNRSILCDAGNKGAIKRIKRIAGLEFFSTIPVVIMEDYLNDYFDALNISPYMLFSFPVKKGVKKYLYPVIDRKGSVRVQTLRRVQNPMLWDILDYYRQKMQSPLIVNAPIGRDTPIINTPEETINFFIENDIDGILMSNLYIRK